MTIGGVTFADTTETVTAWKRLCYPDSPFLYVEPWAAGCGGSTLSATLIGEYGKMYKIAPVVQEYGSSQFNTVIRKG